MSESQDWESLIQKHLDGQTTEGEAEALSKQIVENEEVRLQYLKAAQLHGALADETLALDLDTKSAQSKVIVTPSRTAWKFAWPRGIAAGLVAGLFVGLLSVGMVWAVSTPKSQVSVLPVVNGDFEDSFGLTPIGFPSTFGSWSGDPAEVIKEADGNRILRFLETANVKGIPGGGASACNVFQLIDISHLREQLDWKESDAQVTLELSARFRREAAPNDTDFPKIKASCTLHLYDAEPETIGEGWPGVIQSAVALGNKVIRPQPGDESATVTASCLLEPEANIALISLNVHSMIGTKTPIPLGGYFVDDVQLTMIQQPKLPVKVVSGLNP